MNSTYEAIEFSINFAFISCYALTISVQCPWILYFIAKITEMKKYVSKMEPQRYWTDSNREIFQQNQNRLYLYMYILSSTVFETLTLSSIIISLLLIFNIPTFTFACKEYPFKVYLYIKYLILLISIILPQCTFELINITTKFVQNSFLRNKQSSGMRRKFCIFLTRISIVVVLGLTGIGLPFAFLLGELFIILSFVNYYRYSKELYRSLVIITQDTRYEYGHGSVEEKQAKRRMLHYKRFTIWFFIYSLVLVFISVDFVLWMPQSLMEEKCSKIFFNNTIETSHIYQYFKYTIELAGATLHATGISIFVPFYTVYSMYYLCDKFLFIRKYPHRYRVRYSIGIERIDEMLISN